MRASRAIHVAALAVLPAMVGAILVFGGGQVQRCLALRCPPPPPRPIRPLIGTTEPAIALAGLLAVLWVAIALAAVARLIRDDRRRLARVVAIQMVVSGAIGVLVATALWLDGQRWRRVAGTAFLAAVVAAYVLLPMLLAWAAATHRRRRRCS